MDKLLVKGKFLLKKIPGKGGWTYADLPKEIRGKDGPFGWLKVRGNIDGYEIKKYNLMPSGKGNLFLPLRAEIRKKIKKNAGDLVHVVLYIDNEPTEIPDEMLLCLKDEPKALKYFKSLSDTEQHNYIKWIYSAKSEATRVNRLADCVSLLQKGIKFYDQ